MDITAVSLLLVPNVHDKKQEIERIDHLLNQINQIGTSYLLNDVQSNAVGSAMKMLFIRLTELARANLSK